MMERGDRLIYTFFFFLVVVGHCGLQLTPMIKKFMWEAFKNYENYFFLFNEGEEFVTYHDIHVEVRRQAWFSLSTMGIPGD